MDEETQNKSEVSEQVALANSCVSGQHGGASEAIDIAPVVVEEEVEIDNSLHLSLKRDRNNSSSFLNDVISKSDMNIDFNPVVAIVEPSSKPKTKPKLMKKLSRVSPTLVVKLNLGCENPKVE